MNKKSAFCWWKILITVISFLGTILLKGEVDWANIFGNHIDLKLIKEIFYDLSVGIFSAMILIWFIDEINDRIQTRQSQINEIEVIKRFDKVLQCYINRYITLFYCVVTPLEKRKFDSVTMPDNFLLSDMKDLYMTTSLLSEKIQGSAIESFLKIEHELRKEFISLVEKYNFEYFPEYSDIFLDFIYVSLTFDCHNAILDAPNKKIGEKRLTVFIHDLLENNADSYYEQMIRGKDLTGNIVIPYISLYQMMRQERKAIIKYQAEIKKLEQ